MTSLERIRRKVMGSYAVVCFDDIGDMVVCNVIFPSKRLAAGVAKETSKRYEGNYAAVVRLSDIVKEI